MSDREVFRIRSGGELTGFGDVIPTTATAAECPAGAFHDPVDRSSAVAGDEAPAAAAAGVAATVHSALEFPTASRDWQTSPSAVATASASGSASHPVLASRAAASFRQDRRLQRGHINAHGSGHALPVTPTWTGLPVSVLHAPTSRSCLPLPASDSGSSDAAEHSASTWGPLPTLPWASGNTAAAAAGVHVVPMQALRPPCSPTEAPTSAEASQSLSSHRPPPQALTAEDDEGDVEYKWRLTGIAPARFQHLVTQMQFRVSEGRGQCLYELGVSDNGTPRGLTRRDFEESVQTIQRMAAQLQLEATLLQCCAVSAAGAANATPTSALPVSRAATEKRGRGDRGKGEGTGSREIAEMAETDTELLCGEIMVSRRHSTTAHDLSVAFCGAVGCGKSTLMAVLLTARLDDGCGGTRQSLFNHKHELDSGRTSSLAARVWTVPPDADETAIPAEQQTARRDSPPPVPTPSVPQRFRPCWSPAASPTVAAAPPTPPFTCVPPRSITLLDAGGDITKTMLFGLMSRKPDYVCVCVAADTSVVSDVTLYAEVCCAMNTPFVVVVTKVDCVAEFQVDGLVMELAVALEAVGCVAEQVETMQAAAAYCREWLPRHREAAVEGGGGGAPQRLPSPTSTLSPPPPPLPPSSQERLRVAVFCVSSVEGGEGLHLFRSCLSHLQNPPPSPPHSPTSCASAAPFEVRLDCAFDVDDVGPVVRGRVAHGPVEVGCLCYIGPGSDGRFYTVVVRSIHVDGGHVNVAQVGEEATFALDRLPKAVIVAHKGKVLVRQPERVTMHFEAAVQVLAQSVSAHMEPILYTRNARQAVHVSEVSLLSSPLPEAMESGAAVGVVDGHRECRLRCRFLFRPEVVNPGDAVVLHWAPRGIAVGRITSVEAATTEREA